MTLKYFEGHFSLGCHFHVHFSNPLHAIASHGFPAIAELLVNNIYRSVVLVNTRYIGTGTVVECVFDVKYKLNHAKLNRLRFLIDQNF